MNQRGRRNCPGRPPGPERSEECPQAPAPTTATARSRREGPRAEHPGARAHAVALVAEYLQPETQATLCSAFAVADATVAAHRGAPKRGGVPRMVVQRAHDRARREGEGARAGAPRAQPIGGLGQNAREQLVVGRVCLEQHVYWLIWREMRFHRETVCVCQGMVSHMRCAQIVVAYIMPCELRSASHPRCSVPSFLLAGAAPAASVEASRYPCHRSVSVEASRCQSSVTPFNQR